MPSLDQLVQDEVNAQKQAAIADIAKQATGERVQLDTLQESIQKQADSLLGYKIGITAPAFTGTQAGVLIRDPFASVVYGGDQGASSPVTQTAGVALPALALAIMVFLFWKGKG